MFLLRLQLLLSQAPIQFCLLNRISAKNEILFRELGESPSILLLLLPLHLHQVNSNALNEVDVVDIRNSDNHEPATAHLLRESTNQKEKERKVVEMRSKMDEAQLVALPLHIELELVSACTRVYLMSAVCLTLVGRSAGKPASLPDYSAVVNTKHNAMEPLGSKVCVRALCACAL